MADVFQNAISAATGTVAKAKIRIQDNRGNNDSPKEGEMEKQKTGGYSKLNAVAGATESIAQKAISMVSSNASKASGKYNREITVQFNPSSLQISSVQGDDDMQITSFTASNSGVTRGAVGLHIEMSVKLIFDQISNTGAFVQDMLTLSSSRITSSAANAVGDALSGLMGAKPQSVQVIAEAFTAAMRNPNTRRICFEWGDFCYEGMLSRMNTTYTMFDMVGNPVRAEVTMVLYLVDNDVDKEFDEYWQDAYYAAFIDGNPKAQAMMAMAKTGVI